MNGGFSQEKVQRSDGKQNKTDEQVCPTKGITTNPRSPVNNESPTKVNDFFDWGTQKYDMNLSGEDKDDVLSPFNSITAYNPDLTHIHTSSDYLSEKGWELITVQLGIDEDGNTFTNHANFGFFVLYNKYTSIMRVLMNGYNKLNSSPNQIAVTLDVYGTDDYGTGTENVTPSLLHDNNQFTGLKNHWSAQKMSSLQSFSSDLLQSWTYADFYISYDPCVCLYESKFKIQIDLVQSSEVKLTGSLTGIISAVTSPSSGSSKSGFSLNFDDLIPGSNAVVDATTKAISTYKTINEFTTKQQKILNLAAGPDSLSAENQKKYNDLNKFQQSMGSVVGGSSFLKAVLEATPFVKSAMTFVDFFVGSPSASVPPPPQTIEAKIALKGTIDLANDVSESAYWVPGSKNSNQLTDEYPYYNEVIGVFNLLKVPKIKIKEKRNYSLDLLKNDGSTEDNLSGTPGDDLSSPQGMHVDYFCNAGAALYIQSYSQRYDFELDGDLEYFVNPSSGLETEDVDIMGTIVFDRDILRKNNNDIITSCNSGGRFFNMFFSNDNGQGIIRFNRRTQTDMMPLECLASTSHTIEEDMKKYIPYCYESFNNSCLPGGNPVLDSLGLDSLKYMQEFTKRKGIRTAALKLFVNVKRKDNGENFLHVLTYPLEIVYDNNVPTMPLMSGQPELYKEIANTNFGDDAVANYVSIYDSYLNTSFASGSSTSSLINGFEGISVGPDTKIENDVALYAGQASGCYATPLKPYSQKDLITFCRSEEYKRSRKDSKRLRRRSITLSAMEGIENYGLISIYPNPAHNVINIRLDEGKDLSYTITDVTGKMVKQGQNLNDGVNTIQLNDINRGIYLVTVKNKTGLTISNKKIVKN